jgi:glucose-1-phosphate cytidylyltransferase
MTDVTFDFTKREKITVHTTESEPWRVTVVDTGRDTMTGGRIKRIARYIEDEPFFLTYGDGVSNVDIAKEVEFHRSHGKLATMTAVHPDARFGVLEVGKNQVTAFREKSEADAGWINGGFMVLDPGIMRYLKDDSTVFEREPIERCAAEGLMNAYCHEGFWQCMDTLREKEMLERLWASGKAPWKTWKD